VRTALVNKAFLYFQMAVKIKPDFAQAHSNLGNALLRKGNNSEAIPHYKIAIKLKPDFAQAQSNLEEAMSNLEKH
jgi:tetratricopeptide (TPR) repeat protein